MTILIYVRRGIVHFAVFVNRNPRGKGGKIEEHGLR